MQGQKLENIQCDVLLRLRVRFYIYLFSALLTVSVQHASCQTLYGTLTGNVSDVNGGMVSGARVTATLISTNESRDAITNKSGIYTLESLPSGIYRIVINESGFSEFQANNVEVAFNAVTRVDATLKVGTTQTVTVAAITAQLQTDRADVNGNIASQDLLDLPQPTRTYEGLLGTIAGVAPPSYVQLTTNNVDRSMEVEANGTSTSATDVRIEGVSAAQPWTPFFSALTPSVEAISSVSMVTATADASQTLASGSTINVQLKSGTNQFHGELYEFHIDNLLAARPFFLRSGSLPTILDNDLGGTLSGPIIRNRLFFFTSYEGDFASQSSVDTLTVPTPAMLTGDFTGTNTTIYDPNTGNADGTGKTSFLAETGTNAVPANRISSNIAPLIQLVAPYPPASSSTTNNFVTVIPAPQRLQKSDTKIDWDTTQKLRLTGRLNIHPYDLIFPSSGPAYIYDIATNHSYGNTIGVTLASTYVMTPHFVINGSWGFTRSNQYIVPPYSGVKYGADTLHISGVNLAPAPAGGGIPQFDITGYTGLGYSETYLNYNDPTFVYAASAIVSHNANTIKFGFLIEQQHMNHIETTPDNLTFSGNATTLNGGPARNQFNGYADFLLGLPSSWLNSFQPFTTSRLRALQYSLYVTNTQELSPKLTVNYGTSWGYFPVPTHGSYGLQNFNLDTSVYEACGYGEIPKDCGIDTAKDLFGPHLGFAYRALPSFVIRCGYAIDTEQFNIARDSIYNYPENIGYSAAAVNPYVPVGSLSAGVPTISVPNYTQGVLPLPAGASFTALPQNIRRGYTESYNLTIEKEVGEWLAQIGYVGNQSIHQHMRYDINYGLVGEGIASGFLYKYNGTSSRENAILPLGHTNYNSLQATVQRRFSNGYQVKAAYTLSKWLGLCCDTNGFGSLETPIPEYHSLNYVLMPGDRPYIFNISGIAVSPFGKERRFVRDGAGAYVLGGWQLNALATMFSGTPFTVTADGSSLNAPGSTQRADQVKSHVGIYGGSNEYFDVTAFQPVTAVRFGTASYNSLRGPGAKNLDLSLFRTFTVREHFNVQFRMEVFNITNTPHFSNPASDVSSVQYDSSGNIVNLNGFGQITSTSPISRPLDQRYVRVGLKLLF
jgi:hypothetical protein